jgi:NodT family efflux transporter outer membrane factor (OMF) lipoprotein
MPGESMTRQRAKQILLPLREKVAAKQTDEGFAPTRLSKCLALIVDHRGEPPHPALRATFPRKGRRDNPGGKSSSAWLAITAAATLAGCSFAPPYKVPPTPTPTAYKETGPWTPATPADDAARGQWWLAYGDPTLNDLEAKVLAGNPSLAAALARYDEASAIVRQARSQLYPQVNGNALVTTNKQSADRPLRLGGPDYYADNQLYGSASYELDLWGRVRNQVALQRANAQASAADMASTRLSLQADVADDYLNLRGLDAQAQLLQRTTAAYEQALILTQDRYSGGAVSGLDVYQARTQLETAKAQQADIAAQRALMEHAIAALIGVPASSFSLPARDSLPTVPRVPISAPSSLLQRRPDIAAAERRVASANAQIGVSRAAYYPTISLTADAGLENAGQANFLNASNGFWTLGPSLAVALFDGGLRKAQVEQARAALAEAGDNYRSTVLGAFQEVEDNLALCNNLAVEAERQSAAVTSARAAEDLALFRYQQGATTYLDVVTAQAQTLTAERADLDLAARRLRATVDLVRALGGDWGGAGEKVARG